MANEIKTAFRYQLSRSGVVVRQMQLKETAVATTSELFRDNTQIVGTSHEALEAGDVTDSAMMFVENLDAAATVQVGIVASAAFVAVISIPPGYPPAVIPIASSLASLYLKSSAASTPVRVTLCKIV